MLPLRSRVPCPHVVPLARRSTISPPWHRAILSQRALPSRTPLLPHPSHSTRTSILPDSPIQDSGPAVHFWVILHRGKRPMGFRLARQARPTWANRPEQSSYCLPSPESGRLRRFHLCKTRDYWSGEEIFAFEQPCARNRRCWRGIAAECKCRRRAAAQREQTSASKPHDTCFALHPAKREVSVSLSAKLHTG